MSVLLADDHTMVRQGLVRMLAAEPDFEVVAEAADGETAWQQIRSRAPDLAILDLAMPGMSGTEVARRVGRAALDTRCLLLTMHDDPGTALEAQQAGAAGFVIKDNSFEELTLAARTVSAGGSFMTPAVRARLQALRRAGHRPVPLSDREQQVARLLAAGHSSKQIGLTLGVSPRTVDTYRRRLMDKLGVHTVKEVVRWAVRRGLVD
jgi:DNA-binding NarL/FixJ family response regulator